MVACMHVRVRGCTQEWGSNLVMEKRVGGVRGACPAHVWVWVGARWFSSPVPHTRRKEGRGHAAPGGLGLPSAYAACLAGNH
jgi:hypothetical protein